jgi:anti-sigma factor RsiW
MNDALKTQISAFVDGELPDNESELLLRRLSQDPALRQQVAQYLEIGRLIRRDRVIPGMHELRDRIAAALGEEPLQPAAEIAAASSKYTKPLLGMAIAVSVAILALLAVRQAYLPDSGEAMDDNFAGRTVPDSSVETAQPDEELLKQLYLHHNPRLVTWQLQNGDLIEIESGEDAAKDDEPVRDEDSLD